MIIRLRLCSVPGGNIRADLCKLLLFEYIRKYEFVPHFRFPKLMSRVDI